MLNGTSENTALVRSTFERLLAAPATPPLEPISLNAQARTAGLLTPVELLSILHTSDRKIGVKPTIEGAPRLAFLSGARSGLRSRHSHQHLPEHDRDLPSRGTGSLYAAPRRRDYNVSQAILPTTARVHSLTPISSHCRPILFMRTASRALLHFALKLLTWKRQVIQAIGAHKALQPFVATTLLSRLITKKIWTTPPLWEGFVRCAKMLAPQSFPALIQLPREHLRDAIGKQMTLQPPLMEYVLKRASAPPLRSERTCAHMKRRRLWTRPRSGPDQSHPAAT